MSIPLLAEIAAFIKKHELSESQFGVMALNDKNLVRDMRGDTGKRPRRLWPETEAEVRRNMADYAASQAPAKPTDTRTGVVA